MPTKRLHDLPIKRPGVAINRDDARNGEGPFVRCVSTRNAELVTPNSLVWNGDHEGIVDYEASTRRFGGADFRSQGNRAGNGAIGGNSTVNGIGRPAVRHGGNDSGE